MVRTLSFAIALALGLLLTSCGPTPPNRATDGGPGAGGGADAGPACTNGTTQCAGKAYQQCQAGTWTDVQTCTADQVCLSGTGCAACIPGSNYCVGNAAYQCSPQGTQGNLVETCSSGLQCSAGECKDLCADAEANDSYIGCEYWAVDLDNAIEVLGPAGGAFGCAPPFGPGGETLTGVRVCSDGTTTEGLCDPGDSCATAGFTCQTMDVCGFDAQHSAFAVVVSNPQSFAVDVTIENSAGRSQTVSVAAGQVHKIYPQQVGFPDQSISGSGITASAYKLTANAPIVAYQFNPLDNENVFSNDGSLLIPRTTYDSKYFAMTWPTLGRRNPPQTFPPATPTNDYNGYIAIVSWTDGTQVRVTPTGDVRLGDGFAAIAAGASKEFTLDAFEVLNIEADNTTARPEQDLSGTLIEAVDGTATFGVFGGHEAIVIQNTAASCCADHVEEMMFPAATWGDSYAIARSASRGMNEPDLLRIMAQTTGTTVTISPSPAAGSCPTLGPGQFCDVKISADTIVSANNPILVGHYLLSVIEQGGGGSGDPALALAVPTAQFRPDYIFLAPDEYDNQYVSVVAGTSSTIILDGANVSSQLTSFGGGDYKAGRISLTAGQHEIKCSGGCGIEVYGYSDAVSYLFAGGLDLRTIVVD